MLDQQGISKTSSARAITHISWLQNSSVLAKPFDLKTTWSSITWQWPWAMVGKSPKPPSRATCSHHSSKQYLKFDHALCSLPPKLVESPVLENSAAHSKKNPSSAIAGIKGVMAKRQRGATQSGTGLGCGTPVKGSTLVPTSGTMESVDALGSCK